ncbi:hypothetical protein BDF20DRAFT_808668, partial [Mycotypha africana]|uniref:uncharacterized protein n=1 Tax=Mycotypha africana TaxID=64632 RepID=UPI0023001898
SANSQPGNTDILTHPAVYRDVMNQGGGGDKNDATGQANGQGQQAADWDLYPQVIRRIENEGTDRQVEHLHQLE